MRKLFLAFAVAATLMPFSVRAGTVGTPGDDDFAQPGITDELPDPAMNGVMKALFNRCSKVAFDVRGTDMAYATLLTPESHTRDAIILRPEPDSPPWRIRLSNPGKFMNRILTRRTQVWETVTLVMNDNKAGFFVSDQLVMTDAKGCSLQIPSRVGITQQNLPLSAIVFFLAQLHQLNPAATQEQLRTDFDTAQQFYKGS